MVLPAVLSFHLRSLIWGRDRAILGSSQLFSLLPGLTGQYLRRALYRWILVACHESTVIEFGTVLSKAGSSLGENVYIGPMCHLGLVDLERDVLLAAGVQIPSGPRTHGIGRLDRPIRDQPGDLRKIRVGAGSWVGSGATILADVGRDAVVAAGAVVTRSIPDRAIAAGVPAEVLRYREAAAQGPESGGS